MSTQSLPPSGRRISLTRDRVVERALKFIDENGLDALSMHKLGAVLEVKAMSLYHHVANREDLLDGVVEAMWDEIEAADRAAEDWDAGLRSLARVIRDVVRRHPNAAPLIFSQQVMPASALRTVQIHTLALVSAGFAEAQAYDLVRTITSYSLGSAFTEITWSSTADGCVADVVQMLRPGTPPELSAVAEIFCGLPDVDAQFELGLELMLRGIASPR